MIDYSFPEEIKPKSEVISPSYSKRKAIPLIPVEIPITYKNPPELSEGEKIERFLKQKLRNFIAPMFPL